MTPLSTSSILERLLEIRTTRVRAPLEVFELGSRLVESGWINSNSDQGWTVKEQLATAAIECNQLELATVLIDRLENKFSSTPSKDQPIPQRILVLKGSMLEQKGQLQLAKELYEQRLRERETDTLIRKRLISLHLSTPLSSNTSTGLSRQEGIRLLVEYLDTTYVDAEGWLLLAKSYAELGLYEQSLSSTSQALLLQPQNPFLLLYHSELSYTLGEYGVALKEFLRVVEMSTDLDQAKREGKRVVGGCGRRAAFGVKSCISRLNSVSTTPSNSDVPRTSPSKLQELDLLMTRLILDSNGSGSSVETKVVRDWLST
ncbi:hypothetical protein JCM16303_005899 [Sporobolomyces ruberrimus]